MSYLIPLVKEAERRDYRFDRSKIHPSRQVEKISVSRGQLSYEWVHLKEKIHRRDPERYRQSADIEFPEPHPSFEIIEGDIQAWEKIHSFSKFEADLEGFLAIEVPKSLFNILLPGSHDQGIDFICGVTQQW